MKSFITTLVATAALAAVGIAPGAIDVALLLEEPGVSHAGQSFAVCGVGTRSGGNKSAAERCNRPGAISDDNERHISPSAVIASKPHPGGSANR